jgi:Lantibiotic biosynthesis dehydratase C-term
MDSPPGRWHSLHVYYSADPRPLLAECVTPLVRGLREGDLLAGYFFVNHWLEGAHLRLRLKPATASAAGAVIEAAEEAVDSFLARRPALRRGNAGLARYERLFAQEYSEPERLAMYPGGRMPIQVDNTVHRRPYNPDHARYGGPLGVELAEWHFEKVSDLVLEALFDDRGAALAGELMTLTAAAMAGEHVEAEVAGSGHPALASWAAHCAELRERVAEADRAGRLTLPCHALMSRYAEATNDRLSLLA